VVHTSSRGRTAWAGAVIALSLVLSGCQITSSGAGSPADAGGKPTLGAVGAASTPPAPTPEITPAVLAISPADKATAVAPNATVTAKATVGTLDSVSLVDAKGAKVAGAADSSGMWKASSRLRPDTAYRMTLHATGPNGRATTTTSTFRTLRPKITATYGLIGEGATVGVGMPVIIQFDSAVSTKAQRAAVEKSAKVTSVPAQAGAWGWLDNRQLMFRPKSYWKPGTKLTLNAPLSGLQTGEGKWVSKDSTGSWNVGSSMISTVNMRTHQMTVRRGGQVIRTIPVSTGRPGPKTETRYGTKIIIERRGAMTMNSATIGIPEGSPGYYSIDTKWNMRVTWTGEFLHSAPWSTGAQGSSNVSHGCTNMSPVNAQWMFERSKMGDVVTFTGSGRAFQPTEGIGVWVYSYAGWKAQSALAT